MNKRKILFLIMVIAISSVLLFLISAEYSFNYGVGTIRRPPLLSISWGDKQRFIVQSGINWVRDEGIGAAGNVIEFPFFFGKRVSVIFFSFRWLKEEYTGWKSNHQN